MGRSTAIPSLLDIIYIIGGCAGEGRQTVPTRLALSTVGRPSPTGEVRPFDRLDGFGPAARAAGGNRPCTLAREAPASALGQAVIGGLGHVRTTEDTEVVRSPGPVPATCLHHCDVNGRCVI